MEYIRYLIHTLTNANNTDGSWVAPTYTTRTSDIIAMKRMIDVGFKPAYIRRLYGNTDLVRAVCILHEERRNRERTR